MFRNWWHSTMFEFCKHKSIEKCNFQSRHIGRLLKIDVLKRVYNSTKIFYFEYVYSKTFPENWDSKQSFFVLILTTAKKIFFFRNKPFLFFKIGSWNFQHLFKNEFRETSQNFNSIRQPREKMLITIVWMSWMSWNFVRFHKIYFQTDAESFSFLSWKTKSFIHKKIFFWP